MSNIVIVKISGLNLIRIINRLVEKNILISNVIIKPKFIKFSIEENKLIVLDKICKKEHKFYQIVQKNGIKQLFFSLPYYFGAFVATIIIVCYFVSTSLFINSVYVTYSSNLDYDLSMVTDVLNKNGIVSGMLKNKYKISEIQKLIMLEVDSVEGCEVRLSGNNLNICIYPATKKYEISSENLYAKYDGIIVEAEAFSGKLKVKKGDTISKGDMLIENDNGASGKILAKTYFTATKIYNEVNQETIYTGKEYILKNFEILSKFKIMGKNYCNFNSYLVEKCDFWINKNLFLPIKCEKFIYREVELREKIIPFEVVKDKIKDELYLQAKQSIKDENITNVTYSIVTEGTYTRIDCFVEAIVNLI